MSAMLRAIAKIIGLSQWTLVAHAFVSPKTLEMPRQEIPVLSTMSTQHLTTVLLVSPAWESLQTAIQGIVPVVIQQNAQTFLPL